MRLSPTCAMLRRSPFDASRCERRAHPSFGAFFFRGVAYRLIRQPNRARQPVRRFRNSVDASAHQRLRRIRPSVAAMPHDAVHRETARDFSRSEPSHTVRQDEQIHFGRDAKTVFVVLANATDIAARPELHLHGHVSLRIRLCLAAPSPHGFGAGFAFPHGSPFCP